MSLRHFLVPLASTILVVACANQSIDAGDTDSTPGSTSGPTFVDTSDAGRDGIDSAVDAGPIAMCAATECPYPHADCPGSGQGFRCSTDLLTDPTNCGACGNTCPLDFYDFGFTRAVSSACVGGKCQIHCEKAMDPWDPSAYDPVDCNGLVDDGCEIDIKLDPNNCGACGNTCPNYPDGTQQPCSDHECGCPAGFGYCSGLGCIDLGHDDDNCGVCGNVCPQQTQDPPPHMNYGCHTGACANACDAHWADCNSDYGSPTSDGCETPTDVDGNCGECGKKCPAGSQCLSYPSGAQCVASGCPDGLVFCDDYYARKDKCTDLLSDIDHCGGCGIGCHPGPNKVGKCVGGYCTDGYCVEGYADCDGDPTNGCEVNLLLDGTNCGACGNRCDVGAGQPCVEGRCYMVECDSGVVTK